MRTLSKYTVAGIRFALVLLPVCLCAGAGDVQRSPKDNGSHDSLLAALESAQYAVDKVGEDARAGNPANRLRMDFSREGLRLGSTTHDENWSSEWSLESFGYGMRTGKSWARA